MSSTYRGGNFAKTRQLVLSPRKRCKGHSFSTVQCWPYLFMLSLAKACYTISRSHTSGRGGLPQGSQTVLKGNRSVLILTSHLNQKIRLSPRYTLLKNTAARPQEQVHKSEPGGPRPLKREPEGNSHKGRGGRGLKGENTPYRPSKQNVHLDVAPRSSHDSLSGAKSARAQ